MSREEKLNKIIEMTKEMIEIIGDDIKDKEIDQLYFQTKFALETYKEMYGIEEGKNNELS